MARAALDWTVHDLAQAAGVHRNTIQNFEGGRYSDDADKQPEKILAMQAALERAGVLFIAENGGGAGVRLRKPGED